MDSQTYNNGSYNPTLGGDASRPIICNTNPTCTSAPPLVQQGYLIPYMYPPCPPPPPPSSSAPQALLTTMPVTTQSNAHLSYIYPTAQHNSQQGGQSDHRSSNQLPFPSPGQTYLPSSTVLPPPPPLPPATTSPQGQALYRPSYSIPSFPISVPLGNLEPPGVFLPPPPTPSSSSLVPDLTVGRHVGDGGSAKGSSIHYESLSSPKKAEGGANSDTEMEDDITQPEGDLGVKFSSQALNCSSYPTATPLFNTEQLTSHHVATETNSTMGPSRIPLTLLHGYNALDSYAQLCQERDDDVSRQASSSPYSGRAKNVPESGSGDMYDPFLDSIEPLPNLSKMSTRVQEHELASDSDTMLKLSSSSYRQPNVEENIKGNDTQVLSGSDTTPRPSLSSNKPPDVEENSRGNDIGGVIPGTSGDNEEFGENANGEAGGVSSGTDSPDSLDGITDSNTKIGEDENIGKKSPEKRNDRESRSMRHFKVALTQFVKDLLKPSWRQGNMSKEAFKTIVMKTVDKVSNSMEGRRIPKSRAKIDRYIDSSRHKLTKLVMGYVHKYVKA